MKRALLLVSLCLLARASLAGPLSTGSVRIYAGSRTDAVARELAATTEEDRADLSRDLGRDYDGITDVYLAGDAASFQALQPSGANVPTWAVGVAYPDRNLVILRTDTSSAPRAVLRHELSHIAVGRLTHGVPRWFLEGLAIIRAGDAWSREGPSLIRAGLADNFLPLEALRTAFPARPSDAELAYAESAAVVQFLIDRQGEAAVQEILRQVVRGSPFDDAVLRVTGFSPRQLENSWRRSLDKWVLSLDFLASRDLLWMAITLLALFTGLVARSRRRARLARLEREEQAEAARAFLRAPALWADDPFERAVAPPNPPGERLIIEGPRAAVDDPAPRKPTIH